MCDIDLDNHDFMSINNAGAEFDGCGHTIRGLHAVSSGAYTDYLKNFHKLYDQESDDRRCSN